MRSRGTPQSPPRRGSFVPLSAGVSHKKGAVSVPKNMNELVAKLKLAITQKRLTNEEINKTIDSLRELGHNTYDRNKFPPLEDTESFDVSIGSTPRTLAEALLWKLGKWPTYKTFVENYKTENLEVSKKGGVVFSAFAKHLQNNDFPIYDQHAIRSIWAICELEEADQDLCKSLLLDTSGAWKQAGSGDDGSCYKLFVDQVESVCKDNNVSHRDLDMLLMPLGQAIKKETRTKKKAKDSKSDFERFSELCRSTNG